MVENKDMDDILRPATTEPPIEPTAVAMTRSDTLGITAAVRASLMGQPINAEELDELRDYTRAIDRSWASALLASMYQPQDDLSLDDALRLICGFRVRESSGELVKTNVFPRFHGEMIPGMFDLRKANLTDRIHPVLSDTAKGRMIELLSRRSLDQDAQVWIIRELVFKCVVDRDVLI